MVTMNKTTVIVSAVVSIALIAAYVIVTVLGNDGNGILGVLLGWLGGSAVHPAAQAAKS